MDIDDEKLLAGEDESRSWQDEKGNFHFLFSINLYFE